MSRGLGRIQRECLRVIKSYQTSGRTPTTFTIAAKVYRVEPDQDGNRWVSDAQHASVRRALINLRRKGLVHGEQATVISADGTRILAQVRSPTDGRAERCCLWSIRPVTIQEEPSP
jgi:hypothetical protein